MPFPTAVKDHNEIMRHGNLLSRENGELAGLVLFLAYVCVLAAALTWWYYDGIDKLQGCNTAADKQQSQNQGPYSDDQMSAPRHW